MDRCTAPTETDPLELCDARATTRRIVDGVSCALCELHAAELDEETHYLLAPGVLVDRTRADELADNCRPGDGNVRLFVAPRVGGGLEVYLETNGDPCIVCDTEAEWACSVEQAAEALELTPSEVYDLVIAAFPECEWRPRREDDEPKDEDDEVAS